MSNGQRAEQARQEQFYIEMQDVKGVEFIYGKVVKTQLPSLAQLEAEKNLYGLLDTYVEWNGLGFVGSVMIALTYNDYQPDISYFAQEKASRFQRDQWKFPAPDFVVEVLSESTEAIDRGVKSGTIQSTVIQGFEIPVRAVFDPAEQLKALQTIGR